MIGIAWWPCIKTVAQKKSFQIKVKINTDSAAIAGLVNGRTIFKNILNSEVPSILAASNNSFGKAYIKFLMNKVQKPV